MGRKNARRMPGNLGLWGDILHDKAAFGGRLTPLAGRTRRGLGGWALPPAARGSPAATGVFTTLSPSPPPRRRRRLHLRFLFRGRGRGVSYNDTVTWRGAGVRAGVAYSKNASVASLRIPPRTTRTSRIPARQVHAWLPRAMRPLLYTAPVDDHLRRWSAGGGRRGCGGALRALRVHERTRPMRVERASERTHAHRAAAAGRRAAAAATAAGRRTP